VPTKLRAESLNTNGSGGRFRKPLASHVITIILHTDGRLESFARLAVTVILEFVAVGLIRDGLGGRFAELGSAGSSGNVVCEVD
jgi:hypothetical protein